MPIDHISLSQEAAHQGRASFFDRIKGAVKEAAPHRNPAPRTWRRPALGAMTAILGLCCDPFHTEFAQEQAAERYQANRLSKASDPGDRLRVMTWNIKFGGGRIDFFFDCHGERVLMDKSEVLAHLEGIAAKIRQVDPDVLLLQEVDVASKRSAYVDQLQWLIDHTQLNHGFYASQWKADYVPSSGIGAVDSGNAILSRWPLAAGVRHALPLREEQSGLERYFYLQRNIVTASAELPGHSTPLEVVLTHTAAYSQDGTKEKHIARFIEQLAKSSAAGPALGGGDLNTLPPESVKQHGFPDSVCEEEFEADDFRGQDELLLPLYEDYHPAVDLQSFHSDNTAHFSHTTSSTGFWNRKLDYLFSDLKWVSGATLTHQDKRRGGLATMPLSDHAPLSGELELP